MVFAIHSLPEGIVSRTYEMLVCGEGLSGRDAGVRKGGGRVGERVDEKESQRLYKHRRLPGLMKYQFTGEVEGTR